MNNKKLQEFKDDAAADSVVAGVTSSLTKLASSVTNVKDFSRVVEALAKWIQRKKGSQLSSLDSNTNYKTVMNYLNKMQSDEEKSSEKSTEKPTSTPVAKKP